MKITKSQLQQVIREELEAITSEPPEDPIRGLIKVAAYAYRELGDWMEHPNAPPETGRVVDQLYDLIIAAGGRVDAGADE